MSGGSAVLLDVRATAEAEHNGRAGDEWKARDDDGEWRNAEAERINVRRSTSIVICG